MVAFLLVVLDRGRSHPERKGIEIPQSIAEVAPKQSVVVMITRTDLFVQGEFIATVEQIRAVAGEAGRAAARRTQAPAAGRHGDQRARYRQREITIMADKALPTKYSSA